MKTIRILRVHSTVWRRAFENYTLRDFEPQHYAETMKKIYGENAEKYYPLVEVREVSSRIAPSLGDVWLKPQKGSKGKKLAHYKDDSCAD